MTVCSIFKRYIMRIGRGGEACFKVHLVETGFSITSGNKLKLSIGQPKLINQPSILTNSLFWISLLGLLILFGLFPSCSFSNVPESPTTSDKVDSTASAVIPVYRYRVISVYPHDRNAFTQGLVFDNGVLYEGTGLYGRSTLRRVELETGDVLQMRELPAHLFGEGVTIYGNNIIQLTWRSHVGFVYDKDSFELLHEFYYSTEGWGITHDGKRLIMSDGTSTLYFLDPETFENIGQIEVRDKDIPVTQLNELEYVQGEVYANVWQTDRIARIAPDTGQVTGWMELEGLLSPEDMREGVDVLNGIAYDAKNNRLFVTGKLWPRLFEITLISLE